MCLSYKNLFLLLTSIRVQMLNTLVRDREIVESEQNTHRQRKQRQGDRWTEAEGETERR